MFEEVKMPMEGKYQISKSPIEPSCIRVEFDKKQLSQLNIHL